MQVCNTHTQEESERRTHPPNVNDARYPKAQQGICTLKALVKKRNKIEEPRDRQCVGEPKKGIGKKLFLSLKKSESDGERRGREGEFEIKESFIEKLFPRRNQQISLSLLSEASLRMNESKRC